MPQLKTDQKELLKKFIELYKKWNLTEEGKKNLDEHKSHNAFFAKKLSKENIDKINEDEFREIYKKLWASNIWSNKNWYIDNKLLKINTLSKIKDELKKLLYGEENIEIKFDIFKEKIQGFGPSSISEILHFVFPNKYCLWNDKPKSVLPYLKIDLLPEKLFKYNLQSGKDYVQTVNILSLIKDELSNSGIENPNFIDVDCLLYYIFINIDWSKETKKEKSKSEKKTQIKIEEKTILKKQIQSHEEAEYYLLKLGELLGYLTYTVDGSKLYNNKKLLEYATLKDIPDFAGQRDKNSAREIDIIWFNEDQNPTYCLEVEHTTDITKGLNRLLQLQHFNVTFVILSHEDRRSKYEIEMSKSPYRNLKNRYRFISYEELIELYESVLKYKELKNKLLD